MAEAKRITPKAPIESNSVVFVRTTVRQTDYIGVLPSHAAELGTEAGDLVCVPLERIGEHSVLPRLVRPIGLVHSASTDLTPAGQELLRSITTVCHELKLIRRPS
ncbi:MAG: hypothetical protein HY246_07020 [Proteobacteria bacterium]|nr:hypothetical protein [Pseudomonadota bacterium]